ncbi:hypothetical protein HN51_018929 [Arachis hypogaea]
MASLSSLSVVSESKYDIFVSFRGVDTRRGFLSHLIKALNQKQIEIYVDYKLREGTQISHSLLTAIEESEISLIIFSQDYASSKWCLDELVKIMKCRKEKGQTAIPIFYDVDPSCVRHQRGSYVDALSGHRKTSSAAQLLMWKEALNEAANLSDAALIDEIVKRVLQRLNEKCQGDLQGLVGMVCHEFEGLCFLDNVREKVQKYGINHLKKELVSKLLDIKDVEKDVVSFIMPIGITDFAKRRLRRRKVLLVLDDVSDSKQLEDLCGGHDWFGLTSRIMVTTRDKHVLNRADHIHEVKALNQDESLELFKLNAMKQNYMDTEQVEQSMRVLNYAKGIPLALKVMGSFLCGKSKQDDDLLREMGREVVREESPNDPGKRSRLWDSTDIYKVLKYDTGTETIESITLDMSKIDMLSLHPQIFARMYKLKFLNVHSWDGEHRLCAPHGIESLSDELRFFQWEDYPSKSLPLSFCAENLVEIIMPSSQLEKLWEGVQNLVNLKLVDLNYSSHLVELPDFSKAPNLEEVNVSNCKSLQQVPQSVLSSQKLGYLFLNDCNELRSFQHNIHHQSLKTLSFHSCIGLREFSLTQLNHGTDKLVLSAPLERLKLDYCSNLSLLPDNISMLSSLKDLSMCHSSVRSLPESIKHLSRLKYLNLSNCEKLQSIPELPLSILVLIAVNCTSLHTVFMAEPIKEENFGYKTFAFTNCVKLEKATIQAIMANAYVRIQQAANAWLPTAQRNEYYYANFDNNYELRVHVCLPGSQVPGWFSYRTTETCMTVELVLLASSISMFRGFIFCAVLPPREEKGLGSESLKCSYFIETSDGPSVRDQSSWVIYDRAVDKESDNVYMWYDRQCCIDMMRRTKQDKVSDEDNVHKYKVLFDFHYSLNSTGIKECGVHPIYVSDTKSKRRPEITQVDENQGDLELEEPLSSTNRNFKMEYFSSRELSATQLSSKDDQEQNGKITPFQFMYRRRVKKKIKE